MAARLIPAYQTFHSANGVSPLSGGKISFFVSESVSTFKDTFSDDTLLTANTNPLILDSAGRVQVDVWGDGAYKMEVADSTGTVIDTFDPVTGSIFQQAVNTIAELTALLKASLTTGDQIEVSGYFAQADGGGSEFHWDSASTATANGVTVIASDEGGTGRWLAIVENNTLSILQAGATTASLDNTTFIQNALDTGFDITGPAGTFISTTLTTSSNQKVFGNRNFIIKLKDSVDVDLIDLGALTNTIIDGIGLDGNKANQTVDFNAVVVRGNGTTNCQVKNCKIINSTLTGINVLNSFGFRVLYNVFEDCGTMDDGQDPGDAVFLGFNEDDLVLGNRILRCARIGVVLKGASGTENKGGRVIGNYIKDAGQNALTCEDGAENFLIAENVIDTTGINTASGIASGIACGQASLNGKVIDNVIVDSGDEGIEMPNGPDNIVIQGNVIVNPVSSGIQIAASDAIGGCDNIVIQGNQITDAGLNGIQIVAATSEPLSVPNLNRNIVMEDNQIIDCGSDGIVASSLVSFKIDNNNIKDTIGAGARVVNSKDGSISSNVIDGAGSRGVYVQGATVNCDKISVLSNDLTASGTWGVFMIASDNATVMNNKIGNRSAEFKGAHDGSGNAATLTDTTANFVVNALVGYILYNITDGSNGTVTANTATTVTAVLAGGTDDDWDVSDVYELYTISRNITTIGVRSEGAGNSNLIVNNDLRDVATKVSSVVSGTADTTTPNFT